MRAKLINFSGHDQKWRSRPGDGAGSFDPVRLGTGRVGTRTGFLLARYVDATRLTSVPCMSQNHCPLWGDMHWL